MDARPRKKGPKTKLTPAVAAKICELVEAGNFATTAAAALGIPASTLSDWIRKGEQSRSGILAEFTEALLRAEGKAELDMVALVKTAAVNNPKHAQFYISRRWAEKWSRHDNVTLTGPQAGPVGVKVEDARSRLIDRLTALVGMAGDEKPTEGGGDGSNGASADVPGP